MRSRAPHALNALLDARARRLRPARSGWSARWLRRFGGVLGAAMVAVLTASCGADDDGNGAFGDSFNGSNGGSNGSIGSAPPQSGSGRAPSPTPPSSPNDGAPVQGEVDAESGAIINPFIRALHDPFSTFAADVDSASYDIFAKAMDEDFRLSRGASVRTEEFVNAFRYDYPEVSDAAHPFEIHLDAGPVPAAETVLLRVGVQGRRLAEDRPGANLVFLVDVSGSMTASDKLPLVQSMLIAALDVLRPDDTVSIVTYASGAQVVLGPTAVNQRVTISDAVAGLSGGGSTAGAAGLQLAYDQAALGQIGGGINHILLCTDGDFNVGPSTNEELLDIVEERRRTGVTFTALGFGLGNLNDRMMEAISNAGNGIYRVISSEAAAARYVEHRLLSDVVHIAKDVKLQVEFNPELVHAYRQIGYENRQLEDDEFRDDLVDAGEVGSGHQMTALYELALNAADVPTVQGAPSLVDGDPVEGEREIEPSELVMVKLRYKAPGAAETDPATEIRASLPVDARLDALDSESEFAWVVSTLSAQLRGDPFSSEAQVEAAEAALQTLVEGADPERQRFGTYFQRALDFTR